MKLGTYALGLFALATLLMSSSCDDGTADKQQREQQEKLNKESNMQVGMPAIVNFAEKRFMKMILELRDNPKLTTTTYIVDLNGKLHKLCDSIGYGLPYGTQYTNPQRVAGGMETPSTGNVAIPQADPNGLFSPPQADATWVLCFNPQTKNVSPVYVEPHIIASPFPMDTLQ